MIVSQDVTIDEESKSKSRVKQLILRRVFVFVGFLDGMVVDCEIFVDDLDTKERALTGSNDEVEVVAMITGIVLK